MTFDNAAGLLITIALVAYLLYALIAPEKM